MKSAEILEGLVYRVGKAEDASKYDRDPSDVGTYRESFTGWTHLESGTFVLVTKNDGGRYVNVQPFAWTNANGTYTDHAENTVWDDDHHQAWRNTHMELAKYHQQVAVQMIQPVPDDWPRPIDCDQGELIDLFVENQKVAHTAWCVMLDEFEIRRQAKVDKWAEVGQKTRELLNLSDSNMGMKYGLDTVECHLSMEDVKKIEDLVNWKEDNAFL